MSLGNVLRFLGLGNRESEEQLRAIAARRQVFDSSTDAQVRAAVSAVRDGPGLVETFALAATIAERVLGLRMFDVQMRGALALSRGHIAEMQTGEGKTLAAVPAVVWYALRGRGVHVLTANDYLAGRDAEWMRGIYEWFGLRVGHIAQGMSAEERRAAYLCDVTYATPNEVGFDYLRDGLARLPQELVHRPFAFAVFDEADSILIDEARIPLVIAGGTPDLNQLVYGADALVRGMHRNLHFTVDEAGRIIQLTDAGIAHAEHALGCGNLYEERNFNALTALQDALHAHTLLKRDVDYVVRNGAVEIVDEFKGRIAQDRRWPAGLQSALEAKERVGLKSQGRVLGSVTIQGIAQLYERICGMTGTAVTQAEEFWKVYKLPVQAIPTHRPMIREDLPDVLYATKEDRTRGVVEEIRKVHASGRPILVGTASVEESEMLSVRLRAAGIPHAVLNARDDEAEAQTIARAGAFGAVTVSTNMAGRGTDIILGSRQVADMGGLYVLGTTRHEARRIDNQLRGRAGRQGDPGGSRFFISLEDDLLVRFGIAGNPDIESVQRTAESQNFEIRQMLWKYESVGEHHRHEVYALRREVLLSPEWDVRRLTPDAVLPDVAETELQTAARRLTLGVIDDLWADYLANIAELRGGIHWVQWGGRDPLFEFLKGAQEIYDDFHSCLKEEVAAAFESAVIRNGRICFADDSRLERGATWTYLTTDQPFGTLTERILKGIRNKMTRKTG